MNSDLFRSAIVHVVTNIFQVDCTSIELDFLLETILEYKMTGIVFAFFLCEYFSLPKRKFAANIYFYLKTLN